MGYFCDTCREDNDCWCALCHLCDDLFPYDDDDYVEDEDE